MKIIALSVFLKVTNVSVDLMNCETQPVRALCDENRHCKGNSKDFKGLNN